jgi:putative N6-adenine-specific DNA methylase
MHIIGFDPQPWEEMRQQARVASTKINFKIYASDLNEEAIEAAKRNAATAGVDHVIEFSCVDFREIEIPEGEEGVVMFNPEYGERLGEVTELTAVYKEIGDFFKKKCAGYTGYVFTGNIELGKQVGLKPKRKIEFYNSKIDCRLFEYELYSGSKKIKEDV